MCDRPPSAFIRSGPADPRRARGPLCMALAFTVTLGFGVGLGVSAGQIGQPGRSMAQPVVARPALTPQAASSSPTPEPISRTPVATPSRTRAARLKRPVAPKKKRARQARAHRPAVVKKRAHQLTRQRTGIADLRERALREAYERVLKLLRKHLGQ